MGGAVGVCGSSSRLDGSVELQAHQECTSAQPLAPAP
eukprot:CAMPEP_0174917486 /NCGR_PEP_ID=MMETSP1355-20121228/2486_1 /TAXON_ID=464990 /ORGANISM="Hemiselmis tepida, Strain CCMP443" /LENGTH=36 /DNA_ID= /DNA_START= /DNA_END= /DNA_ORIENTATION=